MNAELLVLFIDKVRIPHAIKLGLFGAVVVLKGFDIDGRVKRAMAPKERV